MAGKAAPRNSEGQPNPDQLGPAHPPVIDEPSYVGTLPDETPNEDYTLAGAVRNLKP